MTKAKKEALVVLHGGPLDGRQTTVSSHDESEVVVDDARYERTDQQEGDYRVYRFATADGEALPTRQFPGPDMENRLHADMEALLAEEKKHPKSSKRPAG